MPVFPGREVRTAAFFSILTGSRLRVKTFFVDYVNGYGEPCGLRVLSGYYKVQNLM